MTQHDYKNAVDAVQAGRSGVGEYPNRILRLTNDEITTITHALRIAEKLMQEPSGRVIEETYRKTQTTRVSSYGHLIRTIIKEARDQMLKEIGE